MTEYSFHFSSFMRNFTLKNGVSKSKQNFVFKFALYRVGVYFVYVLVGEEKRGKSTHAK